MPSCVACKNNSKISKGKGVSFFRFPSDPERREIWIEEVGLSNWSPSQFSRICSVHFEECCYEKSVPDMRQRTQLKKFAIPTIFDEVLDSRREKRKKKRKKKPGIPIQERDSLLPDCKKSDVQVKDSDLTNKNEVRLVFAAKRVFESNEKTVLYPAVKGKKAAKKRKIISSDYATSTGAPRGREALEEFRQKCGLDLSREQISARKMVTQIPNEHNYFVHESARLLKIKLTQAQEELQETKQKLERFKRLLRLERKKKDRTQEKAKRLTSSLNDIKSESNKQKQLLSKFNFVFEINAAGSGNKGAKPEVNNEVILIDKGSVNEILPDTEVHEVKPDIIKLETDQKSSPNDVSVGSELLRRIVTGNNSKKGNLDDFHNFASTLQEISPRAYDYVCSWLAHGLTEFRDVDPAHRHVEARLDPARAKIKKRGKRKQNVSIEQVHSEAQSAVEYLGLEPEAAAFANEMSHVEIIPQAFEIVQQSFVISGHDQQSFFTSGQDQQSYVTSGQDSDCIYYTFEPGANIEWT